MNRDERSLAKIVVRRVCHQCNSPGEVIVGARNLIRANPRNIFPALILLVAAVLAVAMAVGWEFLYPVVSSASPVLSISGGGAVRLGGEVACVAIPILLLNVFPVRGLLCPKCRFIRRYGFGRRIPVEWQEMLSPSLTCICCGYSLIGLTASQCPECGGRFPEAWLVATRKADPEIDIEVATT